MFMVDSSQMTSRNDMELNLVSNKTPKNCNLCDT